MIINDCVLDLKRNVSPFGTVMPPAGWPDVSRYENDMVDGAGVAGPDWVQLPSGLWVKEFDGNDYAYRTEANFRSTDYAGAVEAWFKCTAVVAGEKVIFGTADNATGLTYSLLFYVRATTDKLTIYEDHNTTQSIISGGTSVRDSKWHHVSFQSNGTAYAIYLDGILEALTLIVGVNDGDWFGDIINRDSITLGRYEGTTPAGYFTGQIGSLKLRSYPPNPDQINAKFASERYWFDGA